MVSDSISQPNTLTLYGVKVQGITISKSGLEDRLAEQFDPKGKPVLARIVAIADEENLAFLEESLILLVNHDGTQIGIPTQVIDAYSVTGKKQPAICAWTVDGRDETLMAEFDTASFAEILENSVEEEGLEEEGSLAIRGADGRLYMIPGEAGDYAVPAGMDDLIDQLPGVSIDVVEMKELPPGLLEEEDGPFMHGRMQRGRMLRGPTMHGRMLRGRLLRGRMLRGRMLRGRMLRGRMVTSSHDDER